MQAQSPRVGHLRAANPFGTWLGSEGSEQVGLKRYPETGISLERLSRDRLSRGPYRSIIESLAFGGSFERSLTRMGRRRLKSQPVQTGGCGGVCRQTWTTRVSHTKFE